MEIISFASDQAAVVEYMIAVDESDYEAACQLLGEQSAAAIPEELMLSAEMASPLRRTPSGRMQKKIPSPFLSRKQVIPSHV